MNNCEIDLEDLEYALENFMEFYQISVNDDELLKIKGFEELLSLLVSKFNIEDNEQVVCNTQKTFYEVKNILMENCPNVSLIPPKTSLEGLFPKEIRKSRLSILKHRLNLRKIDVLGMSSFEMGFLGIGMLASLVYLIMDFKNGLISLCIFIMLSEIANKNGNTFRIKTFGDLIKYILRERILLRKENVNIEDLRDVITDYFAECLGMEPQELLKQNWSDNVSVEFIKK